MGFSQSLSKKYGNAYFNCVELVSTAVKNIIMLKFCYKVKQKILYIINIFTNC